MTKGKLTSLMTSLAAAPLLFALGASAEEAYSPCNESKAAQAWCAKHVFLYPSGEHKRENQENGIPMHISVEHDYYDADEVLWSGGTSPPDGKIKKIFAVNSVTMNALKKGLQKGEISSDAQSIALWLESNGGKLDHPTEPAQVITLHKAVGRVMGGGIASVKGNKGDIIQKWYRNGEPFRDNGGPVTVTTSADGKHSEEYPKTGLSKISGVTVIP
jgi:hypothetical protein